MKRTRSLLPVIMGAVVLLAGLNSSDLLAKDKRAKPDNANSASDDVQAIRKSAENFVQAFNRHDAKGLARMWTPDGQYIDEAGQQFEGRAAIEKEYAQFFQSNKNAKLHVSVDSIRLLSPTTALEEGHASLTPLPAGPPARSRYTAIHVKQQGNWLLASVRDTRLELNSSYARLRDLEWLIGDWTAEHLGTRAEVRCHWIAQKSYLQRQFVVTRDGHVVSTSTEIIGWDPPSGSVKSWTFSSDGGRAVGQWRPIEGGWAIAADGVTADGRPTKAVNLWTRLAGDALGWGSIERSAGGTAIEDAREVVLKRAKPGSQP